MNQGNDGFVIGTDGSGVGTNGGRGSDASRIYRDPFSMFDKLWNTGLPYGRLVISSGYSTPQFPPVDVEIDSDTKDLYFTFALAGYKPEEVEVKFDGDYMTLSSEIITKEKEETKVSLKNGIKKSSFTVRYCVPISKYETANTDASFIDGLLKIKIPAKEDMKPKQITIKTK